MRLNIESLTLGIDVGGTNVKMGIVDQNGRILDFQSFNTAEWRESGDFLDRFAHAISYKLVAHRDVKQVGIGFPGMLSADRRSIIELPAIPELNGVDILNYLDKKFNGQLEFEIENDANAAALGEYFFSSSHIEDTFGFITIGTGIGSAAVISGKIFIGGDGNGLELGHIISRNGLRLEQNIGKKGILNLFETRLKEFEGVTSIERGKPVSATYAVVAAGEGDAFALSVFNEIGEILGEGLVAMIRIIDLSTVIVGGGLSPSFEFIKPGIESVLNKYLTPYYLNKLQLRQATLGNDAGLLGAASLCFRQHLTL